jgi:hypothetical protein
MQHDATKYGVEAQEAAEGCEKRIEGSNKSDPRIDIILSRTFDSGSDQNMTISELLKS